MSACLDGQTPDSILKHSLANGMCMDEANLYRVRASLGRSLIFNDFHGSWRQDVYHRVRNDLPLQKKPLLDFRLASEDFPCIAYIFLDLDRSP